MQMENLINTKLVTIGKIFTPFKRLGECPFQGAIVNDQCSIEIFDDYELALKDIETCTHLFLLYWLHKGERKRLQDVPPHNNQDNYSHGIFAMRSPNRPNPIGLSVVSLYERKGNLLKVSCVDCINETKLIDIKPYFTEIDCYPDAKIGWWDYTKY